MKIHAESIYLFNATFMTKMTDGDDYGDDDDDDDDAVHSFEPTTFPRRSSSLYLSPVVCLILYPFCDGRSGVQTMPVAHYHCRFTRLDRIQRISRAVPRDAI